MRYADHQVLRTGDGAAIDRLAARKCKQATFSQVAVACWAALQAIMIFPAADDRGIIGATGSVCWLVVGVGVWYWLRSLKISIRATTTRLVDHLRDSA
jgi:hypothetical protein